MISPKTHLLINGINNENPLNNASIERSVNVVYFDTKDGSICEQFLQTLKTYIENRVTMLT